MKFQLKSVQYNSTLSEETYCFSAKLYIDGVHSFNVANAGQGGETVVRRTPKSQYCEDEVNAWLANNRPADPQFPNLTHCLDFEIGDLMLRWLQERELNKMLKKGILATDGEALFVFKAGQLTSANLPAKQVDRVKQQLLAAQNMQFVNADNNYEMALALV